MGPSLNLRGRGPTLLAAPLNTCALSLSDLFPTHNNQNGPGGPKNWGSVNITTGGPHPWPGESNVDLTQQVIRLLNKWRSVLWFQLPLEAMLILLKLFKPLEYSGLKCKFYLTVIYMFYSIYNDSNFFQSLFCGRCYHRKSTWWLCFLCLPF